MRNELALSVGEVVSVDAVKGCVGRHRVRYFDMARAQELGLFSRVSTLLCAMYGLTAVAWRIYGEVDYWFSVAGCKRHEIKKACSDFEKEYDAWYRFWRSYQTVQGVQDLNAESEDLFMQYMRWIGIPVSWKLGDDQHLPAETEPLIEVDRGEKIWRLYRDVAERERVGDTEESWCVMVADSDGGSHVMRSVETGMDRSSAQMSAKRMSANDPSRLYFAYKTETFTERRTEAVPYKAYEGGNVVGSIKRVIRKAVPAKGSSSETKGSK